MQREWQALEGLLGCQDLGIAEVQQIRPSLSRLWVTRRLQLNRNLAIHPLDALRSPLDDLLVMRIAHCEYRSLIGLFRLWLTGQLQVSIMKQELGVFSALVRRYTSHEAGSVYELFNVRSQLLLGDMAAEVGVVNRLLFIVDSMRLLRRRSFFVHLIDLFSLLLQSLVVQQRVNLAPMNLLQGVLSKLRVLTAAARDQGLDTTGVLNMLLPFLLGEGRLDIEERLNESMVLNLHLPRLASLACFLVPAASFAADHTLFITDRSHPRHIVPSLRRERRMNRPLSEPDQLLPQVHILIEPAELLIKAQLLNVGDPSVVLKHGPEVQLRSQQWFGCH